jgi:N-terminal half of MaoC dehydratase
VNVAAVEAAPWAEAWQPVVDAVGTDLGWDAPGADAVEAGAVRRFCEVLELDCPLHHDAAAARAAGYDDIVAPVSSLLTFTIRPLWEPGGPPAFTAAGPDAQPVTRSFGPRSLGVGPTTSAAFATDYDLDVLEPVVVGDRLHRHGYRLLSCVPKQTSVGHGAFLTWESEIRNQHRRPVARTRSTEYRYQPHDRHPMAAGARSMATDLPPVEPADRAVPGQRSELAEGDALTPVAFPLSVARLVAAAGATRDLNAIHHNRSYARSRGAPDMYANTLLLLGMWERCVRDAIGTAATIRSITGFRMRAFNTTSDTVVVRGRVSKASQRARTRLIDLTVWSENARGVSVGPGTVLVAVPT